MKRNTGIDLLKAMCSFMVICIHTPFPGLLGDIFIPLTRIAVPLFFMITGYFYSSTKEHKKEKKQMIKILKLFVSANLLYFFWFLIKVIINGNSIITCIKEMCNLKTISDFLLFNESPFQGHLWYLGAILYVLLIVFIFEKKWNRQKLYPVIPVLLLINLVLGEYSILLFGKEISLIFARNFIFVGLPYFLIGDMLNSHKIKIKSRNALLFSLLFAFTTVLENFLLDYFKINRTIDNYTSTIFLSVCVFLLAVQSELKINNKWNKALCYMGANLSTIIYILHPIFITIMNQIMDYLSKYAYIDVVYSYISPFVILSIALVTSLVYHISVKNLKAKLASR